MTEVMEGQTGAEKFWQKLGVKGVSDSLSQWIETALAETKLSEYGSLPFLTFLVFLLFIHYLAFVLANNDGVQNSKGTSQAFFELQIWLQTVVIKLLLYYGSFLFGLYIGNANQNSYYDIAAISPFVAILAIIYVINKGCLIFTGQKNPEYTVGPGGTATGILSLTKNKWLYVPVTWLQTVTDIIIQQTVPGGLLGYAVGKSLALVR